jgi:hypothetical protein
MRYAFALSRSIEASIQVEEIIMRAIFCGAILALSAPISAWAYDQNYVCPSDSNVCAYDVVAEARKGYGTAGKTGDTTALIIAPGNLYFTDATLDSSEKFGVHFQCQFIEKRGQQNKHVSGRTLIFVKAYRVRSHVETGSNGGQPSNAHIHCKFNASVTPLP